MSMRSSLPPLAVALTVAIASSPQTTEAQETGRLTASVQSQGSDLSGAIVMFSCARDGALFYTAEGRIGGGFGCQMDGTAQIPVGQYEVRVEGEGLMTEVKEGIQVFPGNYTNLTFDMKAGEGAHIVEYATGPLSREEVAHRLRALEASQAELTSTLEEIKAVLEDNP